MFEPGENVMLNRNTPVKIIREDRRYRQDGYLIVYENSQNGYGSTRSALPSWVPATSLTKIEGK
jgi:hypothetical protein